MVTKGSVVIDGYDESVEKYLDIDNTVSCALGVLKSCIGRGNALDRFLRNTTRKRMSDTKGKFRWHCAVPAEFLVAWQTGGVVVNGGCDGNIIFVRHLCGGEGICGDGIGTRDRIMLALRLAIEIGCRMF